MAKRLTTENFIAKAINIHGDRYDYSQANYLNSQTKIYIICHEHGGYWQLPHNHLSGNGCPKCNKGIKWDKCDFVEAANKVHCNRYSYNKVDYKNAKTKVCITCKTHGDFYQKASNHLNGQGCPYCKGTFTKSTSQFIYESNIIHGNTYIYDKSVYSNAHTKVCIVCPSHGEFWQTPSHHVRGDGCPKCGHKKISDAKSDDLCTFIKKSNKRHNGKYNYELSHYNGSQNKICIICPTHGKFLQTPSEHIRGRGCPNCNNSKLENEIKSFLEKHGINYALQANRKDLPWLGLQRLDFYLPDYNVAIECQGGQHFKAVEYFGGEESLLITQKRDKLKLKKCQENGIKLLYYSNLGINYPYHVFEDKNKLLKEII